MTAEEFKKEWCNGFSLDNDQIENLMKEYAKLKCEELLKIVVEKVESYVIGGLVSQVDKDSILNAVDLDEFIK